MKDLKVVFMGTPKFACSTLEMLIENTNVCLVVTQPDKMVGRKKEIVFSPIKELALKNNIEVFQPYKIREDYQKIIDCKPDIIITCAYGQIIPKVLLDLPKYKCVNVHASLLPELRGASPLNYAIINGLEKTGITIMYMDETMDTGDIISTYEYKLKDDETLGSLVSILSVEGANLLIKTLPDIISGKVNPIKQDSDSATYTHLIKREDEHIDFNKTSIEVDRLIRGLNPEPLANTIIGDVEYKIIKGHFEITNSVANKVNGISKKELGIGTSDGIYYIDEIKPSGKKNMNIKDFLNGIDIDKFKDKEIK